jgi:CheY-like chemotaxis protein
MTKEGPIIFVEDDEDDREILEEVCKECNLPNDIIFLHNGQEALDYLINTTEKPFIIFSDINMPIMNGIELRDKIFEDEELKAKAIPFIFLTTSRSKTHILSAYFKPIQGYFLKPQSFEETKDFIKAIIAYWQVNQKPS